MTVTQPRPPNERWAEYPAMWLAGRAAGRACLVAAIDTPTCGNCLEGRSSHVLWFFFVAASEIKTPEHGPASRLAPAA
jgi:hypothetical protein